MRQTYRQLIIVAIVLASVSSIADDVRATDDTSKKPAVRTWQNSTGEYKIEATLLDLRSDKVQLEKSDGSKIWVPLDLLSSDDQTFAKEKAARLKAKTPNPFETGVAPPAEVAVAASGTTPSKVKPVRKRPIKSVPLYGIDWYEADDAATLATKQRKPIMWFRVLGELDGFM